MYHHLENTHPAFSALPSYGPNRCVLPTTPNCTPGAPGPPAVGSTPNRPYVFASTLTYRGNLLNNAPLSSTHLSALSGGLNQRIYFAFLTPQPYPTASAHRCPSRLVVPGTSTRSTAAVMSGVVHVGMGYGPRAKVGFARARLIASSARRRKTQEEAPEMGTVVLWRRFCRAM